MALTRKFLAALGIEDGKIDEIISAHTDTVNGLKEELDKYRDDAGKYADTQKKLDAANQKLSEVESGDAKDKWKVKYDALKEEFDGYKESISAEKTRQAKSDAYRELLKAIGISEKRIESVLKVSDVESVELDDDGKIKDADKLKASAKTEWADFIVTSHEKGADTHNPPAKDDMDYDSMSDSDYYKSTYEASKKRE